MKKHFITFAAIALSMTGLIGCGNDTVSSSSTGTTSQSGETASTTDNGKVQIKLWLDYDAYAEEMEKAIENKYSNIDIVWEHVESTRLVQN